MYRWMCIASLVVVITPLGNVHADNISQLGKKSGTNLVPDKVTADCIAEAVWVPIYGEADIQREKPFKATLHSGVWTVRGTLPKDTVGGVATICISEKDGRLSKVNHGK